MKFSYTILQINLNRDTEHHAFMGSQFLTNYQNTCYPPSIEIYDEVYKGSQEKFSPEELFQIFNINHPRDYKARSLSISDIIRYELPNGKLLHLFCDNFGFEPIDIDENYKVAREAEYIPYYDNKDGVVKLHYLTDSGERSIRINPADVQCGKNFGLNENGQTVELTPAEILKTMFVYQNYILDTRRKEKIKTLKGWQESDFRTFLDYVCPGDTVDNDFVNYYINITPPVTWSSLYLQVGEPYDHISDENGKEQACYLTFKKTITDTNWVFIGVCYEKSTENKLLKKSVYENFINLML